jgi:hypothetical protein
MILLTQTNKAMITSVYFLAHIIFVYRESHLRAGY